MNIELNVVDFVTEDHKKAVQDKITKAIAEISASELRQKLLDTMDLEYLLDESLSEISTDAIGKMLQAKLMNSFK